LAGWGQQRENPDKIVSLDAGNTFEDMHFGIRSIRSSINIPSGAFGSVPIGINF
jgi:hypothetical protein